MSDLSPLRCFLGIEISFPVKGVFFLFQEKYIHDLLDQASLTDHRTVETLVELNVHLTPTNTELLEYPTRYRHIIGSLVYLGVTRPDILYSVHNPSQFILLPLRSTIVIFFMFCAIFMGLSLDCSFHALALYNSKNIVMLSGLVIHLTVILFLPIAFFLVIPSLLGRLRSR
jgi:hypothetical protein